MNSKLKTLILLIVVIFLAGAAGYYAGQNFINNEFKLGRRGYETFYATIDEIRDLEIDVSGITENSINYRGGFVLNISKNTLLLNASDNTRIDLADLVAGSKVCIRFHGAIWESYPGRIPEVDVIYLVQKGTFSSQ